MPDRKNLFVVHSWDKADVYARMMELLAQRDAGVADYSLPPWRALAGPDDVVKEKIAGRISFATAVVVLNTPGLHRREVSTFEMQKAVDQRKRIIVVQPHGDFWRPIPEVLHGHIYRVSSWRGDALGRAIRGEYPEEGRTFDISEAAERRAIVGILAAGIGAFSIPIIVRAVKALSDLKREAAATGFALRWSKDDTGTVAKFTIGGALLFGGVTALLTKDSKSTFLAATAGGLAGAAVGVTRVYDAHLIGVGARRVLAFDPE